VVGKIGIIFVETLDDFDSIPCRIVVNDSMVGMVVPMMVMNMMA